jgi:hypothetical protein
MSTMILEKVRRLESEVQDALDEMVDELETEESKEFFNVHDVMSNHRVLNLDASESPLGIDTYVAVFADFDREGNMTNASCDIQPDSLFY